MLKKNSITLLMVIASCTGTYGQSGFLGSTMNVNAQLEVVPVVSSFWSTNYSGFKQVDTSYLKFKKTFVDYKFSFSASKVINDDLEIGATFGYASFGIIADQFIGIDTNTVYYGYTLVEQGFDMLKVLKAKSMGFSFNFKKFNKGLSPIGKFVGLNIGFGRTTTEKDAEVEYGTRSLLSSRYLYKMYKLETSNLAILDYRAKVSTFNVNFLMGRTIPVNKKVGIDLTMSVPIFRVLYYNGIKTWAFSVKNGGDEINASSAYELNKSMAYSIRRNQGFSLNVGIKYFI